MKTFKGQNCIWLLLVGIVLTLTSCFTTGALITNASGDQSRKVEESELGMHDGWYEPRFKNTNICLSLKSQEKIAGLYKGLFDAKFENEKIKLVKIELESRVRNIRISEIISTEIKQGKRKTSKGTTLGIAVGLDFVLAALILASGAADIGWN